MAKTSERMTWSGQSIILYSMVADVVQEFNNAATIELRDAKTCATVIGLRVKHGDDKEGLHKDLAKRDDYPLVSAIRSRRSVEQKLIAV